MFYMQKEKVMEYIEFVATIFTLLGISFFGICFGIFSILRKYKQYNFTKETHRNCIKRYIELPYFIENQRNEKHKYKLTKKLYHIIFKSRIDKIVFIIGKSGAGRTCLINRFIMRYYLYAQIKGKKIVRISGLECDNLLQQIESIENKNDIILIIDGLEEAFIYQKNKIDILNKFNDNLLIFSKCILTANIDFYEENKSILNDFYYRNADQIKVYATKIYLKPFNDRLITKYINKNIKVSRNEKKNIINRAFQNIEFFSYPLMLSFILFFEEYRGEYISELEVLKYIFEKSLNWESNKFVKAKQANIGLQKTKNIMNQISKKFLCGKIPIIKTQEKIHNVLLEYDKRRKEYRFQNQLFLNYNTIRKYYSKIVKNSKLKRYLEINTDFRNIYFELILHKHKCFLETNLITLQFEEEPYLTLKSSFVFNEKWIMGLSKSLLDYKVQINNYLLMACRINEISKLYFNEKYLDLHEIKLNIQQIEWWSDLKIETLNISSTNLDELSLPYNWYSVKKIIAQNLPLKWICSLKNFYLLKDLDLSGSKINNVKDLRSIKKINDGINLDLSNCGITNELIPLFMFYTDFNDLYLDYNKLTDATIISNMNFCHLNISNNPIVFKDNKIINNKIICNFYFDDANLANCLCGNKTFLIYDNAIRLTEIDISSLEVENMHGLEYLPSLKVMTINLFQTPLLLNNMYANSTLEVIKIKTYCLNQCLDLGSFYTSLENLSEYREELYDDISYYIFNIIEFATELFEYDYDKNTNYSITVGIKKMVDFLNIELGYFYRMVADAYNYAVSFLHTYYGKIIITKRMEFDIKKNYEQRLNELCYKLSIKSYEPCVNIYNMLKFFYIINEFFNNYVKHFPREMQDKLGNLIGKDVKVYYLYPDGELL